MPYWAQMLLTFVGGGGALKLLDLFMLGSKDRAAQRVETAAQRQEIWAVVADLRLRLGAVEEELRTVRKEKHDLAGANHTLVVENVLLRGEVNDLLDELARPHRYVIPPVAPTLAKAKDGT